MRPAMRTRCCTSKKACSARREASMKYLRLIIKNIGRNKRRTVLTVLSVSVSVFLLATMRSVITTLDSNSKPSGAELRVIVRRNTSLVDAMPESYGDKIAQIPGVRVVTPANWFGGIYKEDRPQNFFAQFYVDAKTIFDVQSEYQVPDSEKAAFQQERTAAMAGRALADKYHWKVGDVIELKGAIYPVNPRLTLRAIYTGPQDNALFFHREYVEEAMGRPGTVGTYRVRLDSPESAPNVMEAIDRMFANSPAPTKTETEAAFQASFVSMLGNVKGLIMGIGIVVVFTISLIAANTMAMSARERFTELAVMKALGFRPGLLLTLVLTEAIAISLIGGLVGALGAKFLYKVTKVDFFGFLQNFDVTTSTVIVGLVVSALIGLFSGGVPAINAARIKIVDGLRRVA
ncbi:MAG: ABC transporter ATP-binding protein [Blastocatellia bacterium AA13]|nr:MAG: ABC transporter ATP-binding protein [Blastocatellia bacterium AA13]